MQQLTGIDAAFLYMESPTTFGHVSSLIIYDAEDSEGATYEKTKEVFAERMHLLDPMRRKLVEVPFNLDHPYWVEDPDLDLDFHIRRTAVAPPGGKEELAELVSRIIARPLDRSRPLWELYVIYGLADGRIAQLTKIHHAAIDGVGGAQLLANILDLEPDAPPREPQPLPPVEHVPNEREMLFRGIRSLATQPYKQGRIVVRTLSELPAIGKAVDFTSLAKALPEPIARLGGRAARREDDEVNPVSKTGGFTVPNTRFNNKIGPHRAFAYTSLPLERVKAVKNALGVTVNDVILGMCSGALRTYLDEKGELPDESLRCMIPVSIRTPEEVNTYGNRVSSMLAGLATDVDDPVKRLEVIHTETMRAKETLGALPADLLTEFADFAPPAITARAARVVARTQLANRVDPPFNVIISNVPGPQFPLYAAGSEMLHYFPVSAVADTQAMNMTIQSYNGSCDFGLVACRDSVPDLWHLCDLLEAALEELERAAGI